MKPEMKRHPLLSGGLLLFLTVAACADLSSYHDEIDGIRGEAELLQRECELVNDRINTLQTLVSNIGSREGITGVSRILDEDGKVYGYTIAFYNAESVTFYPGAGDVVDAPAVSVKEDDEGFWWTADGEYIRDADGAKVPVSVTPLLKVENAVWYVSMDGGTSWVVMEVGSDDSPSYLIGIASVEETDDTVKFLLSDGTSFNVPKYKSASLSFTYNRNVVPGVVVSVYYRFSSSTGTADVTAFGNRYMGTVSIDHRPQYSDGYINLSISENHEVSKQKLFVYMDYGEGTIVRMLSFDEYGTFEIDAVAPVPSSGGDVVIKVNNEGYPYVNEMVVQGSDWLKGGNGLYEAAPNTGKDARVAAVEFRPRVSQLGSSNFSKTIHVVQFGTGDFPCYEEYVGNWKMNGRDLVSGMEVSRNIEVRRDPDISGGYLIYGMSPDAGVTVPARAVYDDKTGSMVMHLPQSDVNGTGISIYAAVIEDGKVVPSVQQDMHVFHSSASSNTMSASMDSNSSYVFVGADGTPSYQDNVFYCDATLERQGLPEYYADGEVVMLNHAADGYIPLNIVILGDGYQQKDLRQGGKFERTARSAMDSFFAVEPYRSFMDRFDVYMVANVSNDEGTDVTSSGISKDTYYSSVCAGGGNTLATCDYAKVQETVRKLGLVESDYSFYRTVVLMLVNTDEQSGSCWYIKGGKTDVSNTGDGVLSFAIATLAANTLGSSGLIRHEGGGHAFGRLADEYNWGAVADQTKIQNLLNEQNNNGFYMNVTADTGAGSPWARFIGLAGYEDVGYYEGAWGCSAGIYRSSENSIMLNNQGRFNAPSREIIFRRIILQSEGAGSYSFERFLEYDRRNI